MSDRFKHAFKVALAMLLTYAIAMAMGWEKPFWAAMSVIFCSMATAGDSVNAGVLRIAGTFLAGVFTIIFVALFPQDRWLFLVSMTLFLAYCTYRVSGGSRLVPLWLNAGFNLPLLAMLGGGFALNSFDMIVLRLQETALGVVVYSLVAILVWPRRGAENFIATVSSVRHAQRLAVEEALAGEKEGDSSSPESLRLKLAMLHKNLGPLLEGAIYDSDDLMASRYRWRRAVGQLAQLSDVIDRWRQGFADLRGVDLSLAFSNLDTIKQRTLARFEQINDLSEGKSVDGLLIELNLLELDDRAMSGYSHLQQAALLLYRDHFAEMEAHCVDLLQSFVAIYSPESTQEKQADKKAAWQLPIIDPDRLATALRTFAVLWASLLMIIYVPGFPNPIGVLVMATAFSMAFGMVPFLSPKMLFWPTILGAIFGGLVYLLVLPELSDFTELGALIFVVTLVVVYWLYDPHLTVVRCMVLLTFVILIGAENSQHYSFTFVSTWWQVMVYFLLILIACSRFPISFRPDHRFQTMLHRYFRSIEATLALLLVTPERVSWKQDWWRRYYMHEVITLPQRLRVWSNVLGPAAMGSTSKADMDRFLNDLLDLSDIIVTLQKNAPAGGIAGRAEFHRSLTRWQEGIYQVFSRLLAQSYQVSEQDCIHLETRLAHIEEAIEVFLRQAASASLPENERQLAFKFLGACRASSAALVTLLRTMRAIDWKTLHEVRL